MLDTLFPSVPAPAETAAAVGTRSASPKNPTVGRGASAAVYAREDLEIRLQSRDGDVLEVRRSVTVAAGYGRGAPWNSDPAAGADGFCAAEHADKGGAAGVVDAAGAEKAEKGLRSDALKWVREVAQELEKQQARLLESLLKGPGKHGDGGEGGFVMYSLIMVQAGVNPEGEAAKTDEDYGVPEYWNAENTSDRIVAFATSFAGIFGNDPEFAETMVNAVAEGFAQAGAILGELPGKAGKLNRDTHDLVFAKLDIWLEAWKSGAYNQDAQPKALEPSLPA